MKRRYSLMRAAAAFVMLAGILMSGRKIAVAAEEELIRAKVERYVNKVEDLYNSTVTYNLWTYSAEVSPLSEFFDSEGNYNTIYDSKDKITLIKYSKDFSEIKTYSVKKPYPLFGGAIIDSNGNYYIVYGQSNETDNPDKVVLSVVKYNSDFKYVNEVIFTGNDTCTYTGSEWGTKMPFDAGNCDIALNGNILVCNYARQMYNGHQSNHVIYVDIATMTKVKQAGCYASHAFDQRVIVTGSGDYLFVNQGDAYPRGFQVSLSKAGNTDIWDTFNYVPFHFREGSNRDYGYNETYAQLGGIAEIDTGYVLAGASEKTLSIDTAPTNRYYCGDSEARNLFIQILDKNFMYKNGANAQLLKTEARKVTGNQPESAETKLFLSGDETDYGVLWLTNYTDEYCVVNPKLVVTDDERIVLLWEKFKYGTEDTSEQFIDSYYMILSKNGEILQNEVSLGGIRLTENEAPVYRNNKVYFSTLDPIKSRLVLNVLCLGETIHLTDIQSATSGKISNQKFIHDYIEPKPDIKYNNQKLREGIDYELEYKDNILPGKAAIIVSGIGAYYGEKVINFYIKPETPKVDNLASKSKGSFTFSVDIDNWYINYGGIQLVYSTDADFKSKKVLNEKSGTVKNLKSNKTYYVKARMYITVDGVKIFSDYSKVYKVKIK